MKKRRLSHRHHLKSDEASVRKTDVFWLKNWISLVMRRTREAGNNGTIESTKSQLRKESG
jgi:hypothetical protein